MRYRKIDPLLRVAGILWTTASLVAVGIGVWVVWNGFPVTKQLWSGLVLVAVGGISTAFGLALAFEREEESRKGPISHLNRGIATNAQGILFFLGFFTAGLALLVGMMVPDVLEWSAGGIVMALGCLVPGAWGLAVIFKKRRKRQERSLKAAQEVAEAREKRRRAKPQRKHP